MNEITVTRTDPDTCIMNFKGANYPLKCAGYTGSLCKGFVADYNNADDSGDLDIVLSILRAFDNSEIVYFAGFNFVGEVDDDLVAEIRANLSDCPFSEIEGDLIFTDKEFPEISQYEFGESGPALRVGSENHSFWIHQYDGSLEDRYGEDVVRKAREIIGDI